MGGTVADVPTWTREAHETLVGKWRPLLIPEWTVDFEWDVRKVVEWKDGDDPFTANATTHLHHHYNEATMWFDEERECSAYELNVTVVHECLHCVFRDIRWTAVNLAPEADGSRTADKMIETVYEKAEENTIDRLSRAIVNMNGAMRFG